MLRKLLCVILSVVLLSIGWLGLSGLTLLVALVPLLYISSTYGDSARDWWRMAGWAALCFVLWNAATIWWVWIATPAGPITATIFSTFWNLVGFMLYHYVSKRAHRAVAYTLLVAAWIATEYCYISAEVLSFPWLTLGNGFSGDVWAVQWYSATGVLGGSLWVMLSNVAIFEAWRTRGRWAVWRAVAVVCVPLIASLAIYFSYEESPRKVLMGVVQPNVDCYAEKYSRSYEWQMQNLGELVSSLPHDVKVVALPETALPEKPNDDRVESSGSYQYLSRLIEESCPEAMIVAGVTTMKVYEKMSERSSTARWGGRFYYDFFNSALAVGSASEQKLHHKMRLVIGVEAMPFTSVLNKFVDLGGITGQLGRNDKATVFENSAAKVGPAICYEGIYGDCYARFVREGAESMLVLSNDGWWGNTPGHRRLFDFCRLRAIETRRAVARSANTGVSGFITSRGDVVSRLDWEQRGVLSSMVEQREDMTLYVLYGDWVGRLAVLVSLLGVLYYSAYRIKRKNHLVE